MKKTISVIVVLIAAGVLAYFSGYYVYLSEESKGEQREQIILQKTVPLSAEHKTADEEYYIARIEQGWLIIYKMPENVIYDQVEISDLHLTEEELMQLTKGININNLKEVFEFLENSMS